MQNALLNAESIYVFLKKEAPTEGGLKTAGAKIMSIIISICDWQLSCQLW